MVGGDDVPGRVLGGGVVEGLLKGLLVIVPVLALLHVVHGELPVFVRAVDALQKALLLLLFRYVEEELQDHRAVEVQVALHLVDRAVAVLPERIVNVLHRLDARNALIENILGMHAGHQHLFVVRAVEDADAAPLGHGFIRSPQKIVLQFVGAGLLEAEYLAPLRVHARHHVLNSAVFARRVHRLKNQQHRVAVEGVEHLLQVFELLDVVLLQILPFALVS